MFMGALNIWCAAYADGLVMVQPVSFLRLPRRIGSTETPGQADNFIHIRVSGHPRPQCMHASCPPGHLAVPCASPALIMPFCGMGRRDSQHALARGSLHESLVLHGNLQFSSPADGCRLQQSML